MKLTRDFWFERLRGIAEEMSKTKKAAKDEVALNDVASLVNEIQVYQTELEIQNEELRSAQEEIKGSQNRFFRLFQMAPVGYIILHKSGMVVDVNQTFCGMVDRDRQSLINRPVTDLMAPADKPIFYSRYPSFFKKPEEKFIDFRFLNPVKGDFDARLKGNYLALDEKAVQDTPHELLIAVTDITREKQAEQHERHAQKVLRAIRNITQMMASQKDPIQLIRSACSELTRNMGYYSAWIALLDQAGRRINGFAASGSNVNFSGIKENLDRGIFPSCMHAALAQKEIHVVQEPAAVCHDCPLHNKYEGCAAFVQCLEHEGKAIGLLSVAVPGAYTAHPREKELFSEVSQGLAFALNGIETARAYRRASEIIERSPAVAFVWRNEPGWPVEYVSKNCHMLFKRSVKQFLDNDVSYGDLIHADDRERVAKEVSRATSDPGCDRLTHLPYRILLPDNSVRWIQDITYLKRDPFGKITHYEGVVQDISEKKYSEDIVNAFFEQPMKLHLIAGLDGTIHRVNEGWHTVLGYTCVELEGKPFLDLVHPDDRSITTKELQAQAEGRHIFYFENRYRHKNGSYRTLAWSSSAPANADKIFAVARDITDQRIAEQSLTETKNRFQIIAELSSDYFYMLNLGVDGRMSVEWISDSFERVTTYSKNEVQHFEQWKSHVHPDDQAKIDQNTDDIFKNVPVTSQYRLYTQCNDLLWIEERLRPVWDGNLDRVVKIYGAAKDITRQKKAEQSLENALREMKAVYDTAMVGIMVLHNRIITSVNRRMAEMLGYRPEEIIGRGPEQLHLSHEHFVDFGEQYYWQLAEKAFVQVEYSLRHKSGNTVLCQFNGRAVSPPDLDLGAVWVIDDITERKRMENKLHQSKKVESLHRVAGSVAHHFNNILMITTGNLEIAREHIPSGDPVGEYIVNAETSARRAATLSQLMLTYLGQDSRKNQLINVSELCRKRISELAANRTEEVTLDIEVASEYLPVKADTNQLEQLMEILFDNAVEAVEENKICNINISIKNMAASEIQGHPLFPMDFEPVNDHYACIVFADTGRGIEEDKMDLIFDPFYSDKATGRGLGLAIALGIVRAHKGCIVLESIVGEGTSFALYLPLSTDVSSA